MKLLADFVLVSGFAINLVLLVMMSISKKRELSRNILMIILGLILVIIITLYASLHELRSLFMFTRLFEDGARFMIGPLIYVYIKSIFIADKTFIKKHFFHFLPFLLYWLFFTVPLVLSMYLREVIFNYLNFFSGNGILTVAKDVYVLTYILLSIRLFLRFKKIMKFNYSSFTHSNYGWLRKFLIGMLMTTLFDLSLVIPYSMYGSSLSWDLGIISVMFLILITFYLGYHGLKQSMIYLPEFLIESQEVQNGNGPSYKLNVSNEELEEIKNKLEAILANEKPYLQQELTLNGLAELVGISDKKLSMVLNHILHTSFYDFVNRYRVEEVKEKLKLEEYEKYSLLGVAYTCGFNSKSSFYRAFKKETGISPTIFKQEIYSQKKSQ